MENWEAECFLSKEQQPCVIKLLFRQITSSKCNSEKQSQMYDINQFYIFNFCNLRRLLSLKKKLSKISLCREAIKANEDEFIIYCISCFELYHGRCIKKEVYITHLVMILHLRQERSNQNTPKKMNLEFGPLRSDNALKTSTIQTNSKGTNLEARQEF